MAVHDLKCEEPHFSEIAAGRKRFEARFDDRGYAVGDILWLKSLASGRICRVEVLHLLRGGAYGIAPGYVVMSIRLLEKTHGLCRTSAPSDSDHI